KQRVEVKAATLDPRLQLSHCATPLDAFYPHERNRGSRITVGVRCEKPKPWSLYVSVSVKRYDQVISASRHLPKGHKIGREDLKTVEMEVAQLANHYINKPEHAIGMIVKRGIRAGKAIRSSNLHPPLIIRKGDSVSIISSTSGFDIRMSGKALVDGAKGERIKVQNLSSKRTVEGKVISEGLVQVGSL
ncbi:MAG: flagellar basal body P-ring formation chaperone FlgA, partial [Gammaproteobacteria bacterium]|nr:flagellar basal body P-ring formation chaperone FlgA [Gammaproteobacteria bacterium]